MIIKKIFLCQVTLIGALLFLNACSGNKVVVTTDDSADYQSARQLPPLNKKTIVEQDVLTEPAVSAQAATIKQNLHMSIVDLPSKTRLQIDADINSAWNPLLVELKFAAITVHSRNTVAARIEIGCGDVDEGREVVERGRWSIFNDDGFIYEYCVLQLTGSNGGTVVSMHNRRGEEVSASAARSVFEKILNN